MKEMIYKTERKRELLYKNEIKGYKYYIMSLGSHPTAYIDIPKGNKLYHKDHFDVIDKYEIEVHGGFTYSGDILQTSNIEVQTGWFLGWDYNHFGDFNGFDIYFDIYFADKKWTTEEIDKECRYVIDQIIKINKEEVGIMEELDEIVERFEKAVEDLKLNQKETATKVEEKEYKRWKAEENNYFYYLAPTGLRSVKDFRDIESDWFYDTGNYFKTKEEAKQRFEHMITEQQLKDIALRLNKGEKINWEDEEQWKYYLCLIHDYIDYTPSTLAKTQGAIYCLDLEFRNVAINEIGKERLINYLKES